MTDQTILEGFISVEAALVAASREIQTIYIRQGKLTRQFLRLEQLAKERQVRLERVPEAMIERQASGSSHGGIVALAGPRLYLSLEALIKEKSPPFVVMLDGIEDPFNFGYAIRAFYAAGADGLVVRPRNWLSAAGVVARASAGTSELIPTAVADTVLAAVNFFQGRGLVIANTAKENSISVYEADLTAPLFLVVGGEKRGITRSVREQADLRLQIPYGRSFGQSLGTTAAAAVLAFEIMRQRQGYIRPVDDPTRG